MMREPSCLDYCDAMQVVVGCENISPEARECRPNDLVSIPMIKLEPLQAITKIPSASS
jgi:hypothetical protein